MPFTKRFGAVRVSVRTEFHGCRNTYVVMVEGPPVAVRNLLDEHGTNQGTVVPLTTVPMVQSHTDTYDGHLIVMSPPSQFTPDIHHQLQVAGYQYHACPFIDCPDQGFDFSDEAAPCGLSARLRVERQDLRPHRPDHQTHSPGVREFHSH